MRNVIEQYGEYRTAAETMKGNRNAPQTEFVTQMTLPEGKKMTAKQNVMGFLKSASKTSKVVKGVVLVQPDEANVVWEERGGLNYRKLNSRQVASLSREIEAGEWSEDVSPITFDSTGNLIDGQHRLRAVYETGIAVPMTIWANVDPRLALKIDGGFPRTPANALKQFMPEVKNATTFASVMKNFWVLPNIAGTRPIFRNTELQRLYLAAKPSFDMVIEGFCSRHAIIMRVPIVVAFARAHNAEPAYRERLLTGINALYTQDWKDATQMRALSVWLCALHTASEGAHLKTVGGDQVTDKVLYLKAAYAIDALLFNRRIKAVRIPGDYADPFPINIEEVL